MKKTVWWEPSKFIKGSGSVRWYDPDTGDKQRTGCKNKDEKTHEMLRVMNMLLNWKKGNGNPDAVPLVIMERYLADLVNMGRRKSTIEMKRRHLTHYLESIFKMSQISTDHIKTFYGKLALKYKVDTIAIRMRDLRAFLNWCVKEHVLIDKSPFKGISIPVSEFVGRRLTPDELVKIKSTVQNPDITPPLFKLFIMMDFDTGARHGELLAAEWHEIDIINGSWFIPAHKCKTRINRTIPLSEHILADLRLVPRASNRVFDGYNRFKTQRLWKVLLRNAGIQGRVRVHDIRHTFASNWKGRASSLKAIAGWVTDAMMSKYTHTELSYLAEETKRTSTAIWGEIDVKKTS